MYVLTEACCVCGGLFIHSNVVFLVLYRVFGKQTAEANTPFTNKYDTCLWTRLSGNTCRSGSQAFHLLQYRKPRVDCVDLLKDAIPLSTDSSQDIGCAQHNIVTFPNPTVTLHCSGCSALWCLCIRKLTVVCTYVAPDIGYH